MMVEKGLLISTDVPTKQLILYLNTQNQRQIIIRDLDDTHVFIRAEWLDFVQKEIERLYDQNTYERKD